MLLLKKKKKQSSTTMEDHGSLLYRDIEGKQDFFDEIDFEVSSILLELSHPVVFSSDAPPLLHKWGRTKKRSSSVFLHPPKISPPSAEVAEIGSTSSSSCLTAEAKKTIPQSIQKGFEEEFSTTNQRSKLKITSQPNASSCSVLESEIGLIRAQVGLLAQPIFKKRRTVDNQNLLHLQPLICVGDRTVSMRNAKTSPLQQQSRDNLEQRGFDLNLPAAEEEEEGNHIAAMFDFQERVATKVQAAAQARQRRLDLIKSKKRLSRFISSYQFK